jgi:hypothetical protein
VTRSLPLAVLLIRREVVVDVTRSLPLAVLLNVTGPLPAVAALGRQNPHDELC